MASKKIYSSPELYEDKLVRVMARLGIEEGDYNYDWSRQECWVEFRYKGELYRFSHSVKNAQEHGISLQYGSDAFAQVVLSLEDLARMVERGIYDLSTWVAGMKALPKRSESLDACFIALGFVEPPTSKEEITLHYRRLAKVYHPDAGGDSSSFDALSNNYAKCMEIFEEAAEK